MVDGNGVLRIGGENTRWRKFTLPPALKTQIESTKKDIFASSSFYEDNEDDTDVFQSVVFTGAGTEFVALLDNQRLFNSSDNTILDHDNVTDIIMFQDETNPQTLIVTEAAIWLFRNRNNLATKPNRSKGTKAFEQAKNYLNRCLAKTERTRLRLDEDVPCYCADKYPYNNEKIGDNFDDADRRRCSEK